MVYLLAFSASLIARFSFAKDIRWKTLLFDVIKIFEILFLELERSLKMAASILEKYFEQNTWANLQIIQACSALSDELLDAEPQSATKGTIRQTLVHLVYAEQDYLARLLRRDPRFNWPETPDFDEMEQAINLTGQDFQALLRDDPGEALQTLIHEDDGYTIEPWVIMVQAINHAAEHREQIKSMLSSLGVTPPRVDGWKYGRVTNAMIPPAG